METGYSSSAGDGATPRKQSDVLAPAIVDGDGPAPVEQTIVSVGSVMAEHDPEPHFPSPSIAPSEALLSSGGGTFSSVTTALGPPAALFPLISHEHLGRWSEDLESRNRPLLIEGEDLSLSESRTDRSPGLFPWRFQFEWQNGALLFAGEFFAIASSEVTPSSAPSSVTLGDSTEKPLPTASTEESVPRWALDDTLLDVEICRIEIAVHQRRIELLTELERHFWRSHPQQRTATRQNGGSHQSTARDAGRGSSQNKRPGPYVRPRAGRGRKMTDGSEEDDDDHEDDDDAWKTTVSPRTRSMDLIACPFLKWRPQHYFLRCVQNLTSISYLKRHLERDHCMKTCSKCRLPVGDRVQLRDHKKNCTNLPVPSPTCVIDEDQLAAIRMQLPADTTQQEEWHHLFAVLFPRDPLPESIYLRDQDAELVSYLHRWGQRELLKLHRQISREDEFLDAHESSQRKCRVVLEWFVPRTIALLSLKQLRLDFEDNQQAFRGNTHVIPVPPRPHPHHNEHDPNYINPSMGSRTGHVHASTHAVPAQVPIAPNVGGTCPLLPMDSLAVEQFTEQQMLWAHRTSAALQPLSEMVTDISTLVSGRSPVPWTPPLATNNNMPEPAGSLLALPPTTNTLDDVTLPSHSPNFTLESNFYQGAPVPVTVQWTNFSSSEDWLGSYAAPGAGNTLAIPEPATQTQASFSHDWATDYFGGFTVSPPHQIGPVSAGASHEYVIPGTFREGVLGWDSVGLGEEKTCKGRREELGQGETDEVSKAGAMFSGSVPKGGWVDSEVIL